MRRVLIYLIIMVLTAGLVTAATLQNSQSGFRNIARDTDFVTSTLQTTTVTQQTIDSFTLLDNSVYHVSAMLAAFEDGANQASYEIKVLVYRDGGGATLGAGGTTTVHADESEAVWDAVFGVTANDLTVLITGKAASTIQWRCKMQTTRAGI